MKTPTLWQLQIITSLAAEEALMELLAHRLPGSGTSYYDLEKGHVRLSWFLKRRPRSVPKLKALVGREFARIRDLGLEPAPARVTLSQLPPQNWAESWKRHFKPLRIGSALLVKPSWSRARPFPHQQVITLDPGLSFGTGQHPTTAFCLEQLVKHRPVPSVRRSFLDIGTGSGILAIAAAKLGYDPVRAFDFDPSAVNVALENAQINQVDGNVLLWRDDICHPAHQKGQKHEVVCANLVANLLLEQQKNILATLAPSGVLVLAGILKSEFASIRQSYHRAGLRLFRTRAVQEWQSGAFRAPSAGVSPCPVQVSVH